MPAARSSSSMILPRIKGGKPKMIISAIARMYQQNSGIRLRDIPWARVRRIDTTSSTPADMAEVSTKAMLSKQKSEPGPGEYSILLMGAYMDWPEAGVMSSTRLDTTVFLANWEQ